ncbi:uncharacterized protein THITE_2115645 [Thermothielavioides terrestris NRRL 8126]|uniref:Uncharacterized protein n=1 Tax=Thermothielavioides terrestris (strain ATCC 38088 / NRRL 8126) TaxID=578455 RepID=G2R5B4_THETT|nr:uncharacterized protein THITE_2115645 [Thermothielavioides terrestris NRRL 8126]AEO66994.1 hypothetical protein THITE_2115645 [Thermothielavioides terrestris NRRL 8126]
MGSSLPGLDTLSRASSGAKPRQVGKPEINPVLLEKSDDLIKAEIQLQRQRIERSLKEQFEQRRAANKASEQLAELDVADILAKAMSLVHATPPAQSTDDTAANGSASSDSFDDDNSFYSSRHDTPESNMAARLPNESEDEEMREGSPYEPELDFEPVAQPQPAEPAALPAALPAPTIPGAASPQPQPLPSASAPVHQGTLAAEVTVPGLSIGASSSSKVYQPQAAEAAPAGQSSAGSRTESSGRAGDREQGDAHGFAQVNERSLGEALAREPPVIRAHDLSPFAPQPTHAVHAALTSEPQLASGQPSGGPQVAPPQVTALRKQGSNGSSPDSSPQGSRTAEKKKNKKKKRKADRLAAETAAASPYIKPEPRSPSPLTPQYARPSKRQRHSQQQPLEVQDDEPRFEQRMPVEEGYQERYHPRVVRQERVVGYERVDPYGSRHEEPILVTSPRYERVYYDDHRAPPSSHYPPGPEPAQYVPREVRTVRPAARLVEAPYEEDAAYYRDGHAASRMSVRPAAYPDRSQSPAGYERPPAAMPPPRAPPRRVIIDSFGREYLEPARTATVVREEVTAEPRGPYERALPPRALSRRPETFDDDAILYRPASPAYAVPRRVVTQPEYSYREDARQSSAMPPPPSDYLPARPEPGREYMARASSVRPPVEPHRYDAVPPTYERIQPPSDDRMPRDYYRAASARPADGAARYEVPVAYERRLGPNEQAVQVPERDYAPPLRPASVRPAAEAPVRYEVLREYPPRRADYAPASLPAGYPDVRRETMTRPMPPPPPHAAPRAYSVIPGEGAAPAVRSEYPAPPPPPPPAERYYGRPLPPQGREDEEVVFLDRPPLARDGYREMR